MISNTVRLLDYSSIAMPPLPASALVYRMTSKQFSDPGHYVVLATDYDGTLARNGRVEETTLRALRRAQRAGLRLVMVTGRVLEDLRDVFTHTELFDWIVTENGAAIFDPRGDEVRLLAPPAPQGLLEALVAQRVPITVGRSVVATTDAYASALLGTIRDLRLDWHLTYNKEAVMALPWDVTKATGLSFVLEELGVPAARAIGIGDAENDLDFLHLCGFSVAVSNALPVVKEVADLVTDGASGDGFAEFVHALLDERHGPNV